MNDENLGISRCMGEKSLTESPHYIPRQVIRQKRMRAKDHEGRVRYLEGKYANSQSRLYGALLLYNLPMVIMLNPKK